MAIYVHKICLPLQNGGVIFQVYPLTVIVYKGGNFCDFLFAQVAPPKEGSALNGNNLLPSKWKQFASTLPVGADSFLLEWTLF